MNKVFLIGRLVADPDLRYTQSNKPVADFRLAVNRQYTDESGERKADFINIITWGKQAENVKQYIEKGSQVAVDGRIQTRNYENDDGRKIYVTEVLAERVQFLDTKKTETNKQDVSPADFEEKEETDPYEDMGNQIEMEISDEDLPF